MYNVMMKIGNFVNRITEVLVTLLVAELTVLTTAGIVTRYITGTPVIWLYEVTVLSFAWSIFLGVSIAFKRGDHIHLELILNKFPTNIKRMVMVLITILVMIFMVVVIKEGITISLKTAAQCYQTINVSSAWFYASMPVGASLSLLHLFNILIGLILNKVDVNAEKEEIVDFMG